ncbi:MAG: substrate-binding periplasmic protein [Acidiferrobacterales bacterium]
MRIGSRFVALLSTVALGCAVANASEKYLPGIQQLIDKNRLVVAIGPEDAPPMITTDKNGNLRGYDIELARDIAAKLGVQVEFSRTAGTHELLRAVAEGKADIGISNLGLSIDTARIVSFTKPYLTQSFTMLINRVKGTQFSKLCPTRSELRELVKKPGQIGVMKGTTAAEAVWRVAPEASPKQFGSLASMMAAVQAGELVASLQAEAIAKYFLRQNPAASLRLKLCLIGQRQIQLAIAVRPDAPHLVRWLNVYLDTRLRIPTVDQLVYEQ